VLKLHGHPVDLGALSEVMEEHPCSGVLSRNGLVAGTYKSFCSVPQSDHACDLSITCSRELKGRAQISAQQPAGSDDAASSMVTSLLTDEQQSRFGRKRKVTSNGEQRFRRTSIDPCHTLAP